MAGDQKKFQSAMTYAEQFSQQENWAEAMRAYRFALAEYPNNEAAIVGFGKASLASGQVEFAERAFQQTLKINPTNQEALIYVGQIQEQLGKVAAAAETFLRVGNMQISHGDAAAALSHWEHVIALVPQHSEAYRRIADTLAQQGQPQPAVQQLLRLARVYQEQGDRDQAMQQIQAADQLLPGYPLISTAMQALEHNTPIAAEPSNQPPAPNELDLGHDFFSEGLVESEPTSMADEDPFALGGEEDHVSTKGLVGAAQENALAELADAVFSDNGDPMHTMLIVQAIEWQGLDELQDAAENYQKAIKGGMKRPALFFNLGVIWKDLEQFDQAVEMLNISAQDTEYGIGSQFALGEVYQAVNKVDAALRHYIDGVRQVDLKISSNQQGQELFQHYGQLAKQYLGRGNQEEITTFLSSLQGFFSHPAWEQKAFEARRLMDGVAENGTMSLAQYLETPQTEVVVSTMALTNRYMSRKLLMTASEECLRAIQKAPAHLPLHIRLADILLEQDRTEEAVAKYLYIAKVYEMRGTPEESIYVYQKVLQTAPMNVKVQSALVDIYVKRNEIEKAVEQYLELAHTYYQMAQVDRALEQYNAALNISARADNVTYWQSKILHRVADIYTQRFDWAGATAAYENLYKLHPNDEEVQQKLIDFYFKQNKTSEATRMLDALLALYQRQDPLKGVELLRELSGSRPEDMTLRQRLAVAYAQNGMTEQAIAIYDALGEMQLEQGLRNQAVQTIQAIIHLGPKDVEGYQRLLSQISGGAV